MTRKQMMILVGIEVFLFLLFLFVRPSIPCFFKKVLSIPCPGCGLTRAFQAFCKGQFLKAFSYNLMFYPLLGVSFYFPIRLILSFIRGEKRVSFAFLNKPIVYGIIAFLLICSEVYNLLFGI